MLASMDHVGRMLDFNTGGGQQQRKQSSSSSPQVPPTMDRAKNHQEPPNDDDDEKKKTIHREIERKRRQEMATLYASLRSVLPLEYIKGKRSLAEHMNEAVNYIKHLQMRIEVLGGRRDELVSSWRSNLSSDVDLGNSSSSWSSHFSSSSRVVVEPCSGGVEIVISTVGGCVEGGVILSRLLKILLARGLSTISCVTTQVNKRLIVYTIQSEVSDPTICVDFSGLQQILTEEVSSCSK